MKYSDLKLKTKEDKHLLIIGDKQIQVLQYLPIQDKIDLIQIALQHAYENGIYNEMKLDMYFNLYIVYMYTDLEFTQEEKADEFKLYNELQSNDIFLKIIGAINEDEYNSLMDYLQVTQHNKATYNKSAAALFSTFVQDMPKNAAAAAQIVDTFDKEKYQNVIDFAKNANGDRSV